jgi:plastocyanin
MPTRRTILGGAVALLAGVMPAGSAGTVPVIRMTSDSVGARVGFDPVGLWVPPGTTVRFMIHANVHTTAAYHPANGNRCLRIPEAAAPWNSDYLVNPGDSFDLTLAVEGVYDYYCEPHEQAGMVGRIVVGAPSGPGLEPFDYFTANPATAHWQGVPEAVRTTFPPVERIMAERAVRLVL